METLEVARRERGKLLNEVARLDKVIALLTGDADKPVVAEPRKRRRQRSATQRAEASQRMKDAWVKRKKRENGDAGDDAKGEPRPTLSDDADRLEAGPVR